jgi:molybdopterin-guanine dinucleotide biosynthesis protein A
MNIRVPDNISSCCAEGFVLAGGRSTRMGQDKALLQVAGRSLLERSLDKLRTIGVTAPRIAAARTDLSSYAPAVPDLHPGCGPLGGIEAALAATTQPLNLFLPVDLPLLPARFLNWMLQRAEITRALVTVPRINGWPQPLCAVYHRDLLQPITDALLAGNYKVMPVVAAAAGQSQALDLFDTEQLASTDPELLSFSPLPLYRWFHNCNLPEDMAAIGNALVLSQ